MGELYFKDTVKAYLRNPWKKVAHFYNPYCLGVKATKDPNKYDLFFGDFIGSVTKDTENFKITLSKSFGSTDAVGFWNFMGSPSAGYFIDEVNISRVFNRADLPQGTDIFFSTGNMGSSNGKIIPKIPVEWTHGKNRWGARAMVYLIQIVDGGEVGTATFRWCKWPYAFWNEQVKENYVSSTQSVETSPGKALYSEYNFIYLDENNVIHIGGPTPSVENYFSADYIPPLLLNSFEGRWAESREYGGVPHSFYLSSDGFSIKEYSDTTFHEHVRDIAVQLNGSPLELLQVTFANGKYFGVGTDGKVYVIDLSGVASEIIGTQMTGDDYYISAHLNQQYVYFACDTNIKIIEVSTLAVTDGPVLGSSVTKGLWDLTFDIYGRVHILGKVYNPSDLSYIEDAPLYGECFYSSYIRDYDYPNDILDLNTKQLLFYPARRAVRYRYHTRNLYMRFNLTDSYTSGRIVSCNPFHPDDIDMWLNYSGENKNWKGWDGSQWVDYNNNPRLTGTDIELEDGVVIDFQNGSTAPHFNSGEYFVFLVAEGIIKDNLQTLTVSMSYYTVPRYEEAEDFTTTGTEYYLAATTQDGFIKLDSSSELLAELTITGETPSGTIDGVNTVFTTLRGQIKPSTLSIMVDGGGSITDYGNGNLSDGGTVDYATGTVTLASAPTSSISIDYIAILEVITEGTPTDKQIYVEYDSGRTVISSNNVGLSAHFEYAWLQRPQ